MPDVPSEYVDFSGKIIRLDPEVVQHIEERHPEMTAFLAQIDRVLAEPDFVYFRPRAGSYIFYKLGVLAGKLRNTYMVVIVRYNEFSEGEVRTVYSTTQPARGDTLSHVRPRRTPG